MIARVIAVPVALQRYVDAPPIAVRQRDLALVLAKAEGARVALFSVEAELGLVPQAETVEQKLEAYKQPFVDAGIAVDARVVKGGRPADVLPDAILAAGADLAIVGTHSKRRAVEVALGSTASGLMNALPFPVVLIRPTEADEEQARKMTLPHMPPVFVYL